MQKSTVFNTGCILVMFAALALGFGCAPKSKGLGDTTAEGPGSYGSYGDAGKSGGSVVDKRVRDYLAAEQSDPRGQDVLIRTAKTALGTPYVRGGTSTDGFDCSGFVQWTFNQVGVKLPRTAREQSRVGRAIRNIDDMQVGDIVAFHHPKRGYHTGIYVGDGKFIHSPRKRTRVRINNMDDPYFSKTFMGARRIGVSTPEDIEAAEKMLAEYRQQEATRARSDSKRGGKEVTRGKQSAKEVARADSKRGSKESKASSRSRQKESKAADSKSARVSKSGQGNKSAKDSKAQSSRGADKDKKDSVGQARPPAAKSVAKAETADKGKAASASKAKSSSAGKDSASGAKNSASASSRKTGDSKPSAQKSSGKDAVAKK